MDRVPHGRSAVSAVTPRLRAKARQARSPSDRPSAGVRLGAKVKCIEPRDSVVQRDFPIEQAGEDFGQVDGEHNGAMIQQNFADAICAGFSVEEGQ